MIYSAKDIRRRMQEAASRAMPATKDEQLAAELAYINARYAAEQVVLDAARKVVAELGPWRLGPASDLLVAAVSALDAIKPPAHSHSTQPTEEETTNG